MEKMSLNTKLNNLTKFNTHTNIILIRLSNIQLKDVPKLKSMMIKVIVEKYVRIFNDLKLLGLIKNKVLLKEKQIIN